MRVAAFFKRRLNSLLKPYKHVIARESTVPSWKGFFDLIKRNRLIPNTVFDIGVATGTPVLYAHFPDARYFLAADRRVSTTYGCVEQKTVRKFSIWPEAIRREMS